MNCHICDLDYPHNSGKICTDCGNRYCIDCHNSMVSTGRTVKCPTCRAPSNKLITIGDQQPTSTNCNAGGTNQRTYEVLLRNDYLSQLNLYLLPTAPVPTARQCAGRTMKGTPCKISATYERNNSKYCLKCIRVELNLPKGASRSNVRAVLRGSTNIDVNC